MDDLIVELGKTDNFVILMVHLDGEEPIMETFTTSEQQKFLQMLSEILVQLKVCPYQTLLCETYPLFYKISTRCQHMNHFHVSYCYLLGNTILSLGEQINKCFTK